MVRWVRQVPGLSRTYKSIWKAKVLSANSNFERPFALQKNNMGTIERENVSCGTGVVEAASGRNPHQESCFHADIESPAAICLVHCLQDGWELRLGAGEVDIPAEEGLGFVGHKLLLPSQPTYLLGSDYALSLHQRPAEWQYVNHRVFLWPLLRGDQRGGGCLGIRQPLLWQALLRRSAKL
jgi:hypothetical protein